MMICSMTKRDCPDDRRHLCAVAILRAKHDAKKFAEAIQAAARRRVSAVNYVQTAGVVESGGDPVAKRRFDDLLREAEITVEVVTVEQAQIAREAYRDYGKGSGHRARLNFGDCFAYALAKDTGEPLLFKGKDFAHTDIRPVL